MTRFGLTFHHFGLAARSAERASLFLAGIGYSVGKFILDPLQNVQVTLCHGLSLPTIELVLPAGTDSPVDAILAHQETAFYHTCYVAPNPEDALDAITKAGMRAVVVRPPKPAILFCNAPVSFHYVEGFGLIEFIHISTVEVNPETGE